MFVEGKHVSCYGMFARRFHAWVVSGFIPGLPTLTRPSDNQLLYFQNRHFPTVSKQLLLFENCSLTLLGLDALISQDDILISALL